MSDLSTLLIIIGFTIYFAGLALVATWAAGEHLAAGEYRQGMLDFGFAILLVFMALNLAAETLPALAQGAR